MTSVSTQIAVRLPDEMVSFLDRAVADGRAASRAVLDSAALERERRRQAALEDAKILTKRGNADDLDELVTWSAAQASIED